MSTIAAPSPNGPNRISDFLPSADPAPSAPSPSQKINMRTIAVHLILNLKHDYRDRTTPKYFLHETGLMQDIDRNGLRNPLKVKPEGEMFRIVGGQTRLNILRRLGITHAAAILLEGLDESELLIEEYRDNNSGQAFDLLATAEIFNRLMLQNGFELHSELCQRYPSITPVKVYRAMKVFENLIDELKPMHRDGTIGSRVAVALARLPKDKQLAMYESVKKLNVEDAESKIAVACGRNPKPASFTAKFNGTQIKFTNLQEFRDRVGIALKKMKPGEGPEDFVRYFGMP